MNSARSIAGGFGQSAGLLQEACVKRRASFRALVPLMLFLLGSSAYSYVLWGRITIADATWALVAGLILLKTYRISRTILKFFAWFTLFAVSATLVRMVVTPETINILEATGSMVKLLFYMTSTAVVTSYLRERGYNTVSKALAWVVALLALAAIFQFLIATLRGTPPSFLMWQGHFIGDYTRWYRFGRFRAAGTFAEPSWLAISLALSAGYLMIGELKKWPLVALLLAIVAIILSFSLGGYLLLFLMLGMQLPRLTHRRARRVILGFMVPLLVIAALSATVLPDIVFSRVGDALTLREGSTRDRLVGSWELAFKALNGSWLWGVGIGNLETIYGEVATDLRFKANPVGKVASIAAYVLATTGYLGLLLFVLAAARTLRASWRCYPLFIYFTGFWATGVFLWGMFLSVPFWLFLALGVSALEERAPNRVDATEKEAVSGRNYKLETGYYEH